MMQDLGEPIPDETPREDLDLLADWLDQRDRKTKHREWFKVAFAILATLVAVLAATLWFHLLRDSQRHETQTRIDARQDRVLERLELRTESRGEDDEPSSVQGGREQPDR